MIVIEDKIVRIINYIKLKKIENNLIEILLKDKTMYIRGEELSVAFYDKSEIKIKGYLKGIEFANE